MNEEELLNHLAEEAVKLNKEELGKFVSLGAAFLIQIMRGEFGDKFADGFLLAALESEDAVEIERGSKQCQEK